MKLYSIGIENEVKATIYSPVGEITLPCKITKIKEDKDFEDTSFMFECNGTEVDITIAVMYALQDMEAQNERASEMEKKYNRHEGRYVVKDMSIDGVIIDNQGNFKLSFLWTDCYGGRRIYTGIDCQAKKGVRGLFLSSHKPTFYF